jgi:4-hydroxybenzoate polyprenyltransferase
MICARTAAMLFNRWVDWSLDQKNPRTASRHLLLSKNAILFCLVLSTGGFVAGAAFLNRLTLELAPLALGLIFLYSLMKRFTALTHFFLGVALAIAPVGAWIAQTGSFALPPIILAAAVVCWVAGFDLIYATQDYDFDRREGLRSLVVRLGVSKSLQLAQLLHLITLIGLIAFGWAAGLGLVYYFSMLFVAGTLIFEHRSARRLDVAGINRAFFQSNAFVSAVFLIAVCIDRFVNTSH